MSRRLALRNPRKSPAAVNAKIRQKSHAKRIRPTKKNVVIMGRRIARRCTVPGRVATKAGKKGPKSGPAGLNVGANEGSNVLAHAVGGAIHQRKAYEAGKEHHGVEGRELRREAGDQLSRLAGFAIRLLERLREAIVVAAHVGELGEQLVGILAAELHHRERA